MERPGSLHEEQHSQVSEGHESKDSQAILDALKAELGWGALCSMLPAAGHEAMIENERIPSARSRLRNGDSRIIEPSDEDDDDDNNVVIEQSSPTQPAIIPSSLHGRMETSQPSPTQVNTDRDYRELYDSNIGNNGNNDDSNNKNNNVINNNAQSSEHDYASFSKGDEVELRNLQVDDGTGAVDFGDLEVRASSQISEDAGFENTRSLWRTYRASQHMPNADYTPRKLDDLLPETPAVPRNPFSAAARDASNVPLAGTQLFRETQLLTSAAKQTPASVRPSPRLLYDMTSPNTEPSPLKDGMGISSPTDAPPSSRWKPARQDASRARTGRPSLDDLAFESPSVKPAKPRSVRQPLAHYEPMKHSQQRKARIEESPAAASREVMNSDSDDDALLELERRKRMVEKKKAQAARELDKPTEP
ncbi:hypothetical protein ESCO_006034 [Escovopsis weberi]|uniref:Uncharacterized protein n=1 Tax=Escovopsis weberi TaxID=150374 RepID=A0A0M8MRP5_ESCWE|nr:hypothetical protein ESCO_006034 [Escovopsis weberi]